MNEIVKNIILDYCEGYEHLEFNKSDLDEMVERVIDYVIDTTADS